MFQWISRWMFGSLVSKIVMPSQGYPKREINPQDLQYWQPQKSFQSLNRTKQSQVLDVYSLDRKVSVRSVDKTEIVAEIYLTEYQAIKRQHSVSGARPLNFNEKQQVIITAVGNGDLTAHASDWLTQMASDYPSARVVGFDFRNVDKSTGSVTSEQDWIDDAIAVINYYHITHGIPYENIVLFGHSLGAAILTMAAAQLYAKELERLRQRYGERVDEFHHLANCVYLINSRSFSNLGRVVAEYIALGGFTGGLILGLSLGGLVLSVGLFMGFALTYALIAAATVFAGMVAMGFILEEEVKSVVKFLSGLLIDTLFGNIDAAEAYKDLPETHRDYIFAKDDVVIGGGGLHQAVAQYYESKIRLMLEQRQRLLTLVNIYADRTKLTRLSKTPQVMRRLQDLNRQIKCFQVHGVNSYIRGNKGNEVNRVISQGEAQALITKIDTEYTRIQSRELSVSSPGGHRVDSEKAATNHDMSLSKLVTHRYIGTRCAKTGAERLRTQMEMFLDHKVSIPETPKMPKMSKVG